MVPRRKEINSIIDTSSKDSLRRVIEKLSDVEKWDEYLTIMQKAAGTANNEFNKELKKKNSNQQEYDNLVREQTSLQNKLDKNKKKN